MKFRNPFRGDTDTATARLLDRATSPRHFPPPGIELAPVVPPTVGTANMETRAGRIQIRVEAMDGRLVRQVMLAAAERAECFPEAHPHARASSGFKAALAAAQPPCGGKPITDATRETARMVLAETEAMEADLRRRQAGFRYARPPLYDEADARFQASRRQVDEAPQPPRGEAQDREPASSAAALKATASEAERAALANVATASKAAAADPASATLSDTLAGLRAAEDAMKTALTQFEAQFRGCAVNDVRIERVSKFDGSSRIAGVLIDLKLQNVQP